MNQEQICNFSLSVETAAMQAGSFLHPLMGACHSFLLLWACIFLHMPLVRLTQTKEGQLSKRGEVGTVMERQPILFCFLISVSKRTQKLDRNNLQGGILYFSSRFQSFLSVVLGSLDSGLVRQSFMEVRQEV